MGAGNRKDIHAECIAVFPPQDVGSAKGERVPAVEESADRMTCCSLEHNVLCCRISI
jgi:hypothetical protein